MATKKKAPPLYRHDELDRQQLREVAVKAVVDEKSVVKYLLIRQGHALNMQSTTRARVERALLELGLDRLVISKTTTMRGAAASSPPPSTR